LSGVQKIHIPNNADRSRALPANDVTYLGDKVRIVRGGDGSLFTFVRDERDQGIPTMLSFEQGEALLGRQRGEKVNVGIGVAEKSPSPELQFLFRPTQRRIED
jgi:hypothetical protein